MKNLTLLFLLFYYSSSLQAMCDKHYLHVWPTSKTIKTNPVFMLEGYDLSRNVIAGLNTKYPIYLESGEQRIKLIVKEIIEGELKLKQAILVPENHLVAGLTYTLRIDSVQLWDKPLKWNRVTGNANAEWLVESGFDVQKPAWTADPAEGKKTLIHYECGPEITVAYSLPLNERFPYLVKATVSTISTGKKTTYYVIPEDSAFVCIGRHMCAGAFALEDGSDFKVSFEIMDASGNFSEVIKGPVAFTKPDKETPYIRKGS